MSGYIISKENAAAVLVDVQAKMMPAVYDGAGLEQRITKAVQILRLLDIPILVTQHYTKGLGETTPAVAEALGSFTPIEKITFSCMNNPRICGCPEKNKAEVSYPVRCRDARLHPADCTLDERTGLSGISACRPHREQIHARPGNSIKTDVSGRGYTDNSRIPLF